MYAGRFLFIPNEICNYDTDLQKELIALSSLKVLREEMQSHLSFKKSDQRKHTVIKLYKKAKSLPVKKLSRWFSEIRLGSGIV